MTVPMDMESVMGAKNQSVMYEGKTVKWTDIDWSKDIHLMKYCSCCGIDGGEAVGVGHLAGCAYGTGSEWRSSVPFFKKEIIAAIERERQHALC